MYPLVASWVKLLNTNYTSKILEKICKLPLQKNIFKNHGILLFLQLKNLKKLLIMITDADSQITNDVHHGRNVKRLRKILGIKQDFLADKLDLSHQSISRLESKAELDSKMLDKIAKILNIPVEAIKNYNEENAVNIISSVFNEQSIAYQYNTNPINKIIQLYKEKIELYERLLKVEQEKNSLLEKR